MAKPAQMSRRFPASLAIPLVVMAALWAGSVLTRASNESSIWLDEIYSLVLSQRSTGDVIALTAVDPGHPPLYYLALKAWLKIFRSFGIEGGILLARSLNVTALLAGVVLSVLVARRLFGATGAFVTTTALLANPYLSVFAIDLRSYAFGAVGILGTFWGLLLLRERWKEGELDAAAGRGRLLGLGPAVLLASSLSLALWSHILAGLASLILVALVLGVWGFRARGLAWEVGLASGAALTSFAPWLRALLHQVSHLGVSVTEWMTPASWKNLAYVWLYWFPVGRVGAPGEPGAAEWLLILGAGAFVGSVVLIGLAFGDSKEASARPAAAIALGGAALFVVLIWVMARLELASIFHGPRYPALVSPLWSCGLGGLTAALVHRGGARRLGALLLVPWLAAGAVGQALMASGDRQGGLAAWLASEPPGREAPLYVLPSELMPFFRATLAPYGPRRVEDLPCQGRGSGQLEVLDVNAWDNSDRPRDVLVANLLATGRLGSVEVRESPGSPPEFRLFNLSAPNEGVLEKLCATGLGRREFPPPSAVSWALPETQHYRDGWSYLEVDSQMSFYRWGAGERVRLRFDRAVGPGFYELRIAGYREPRPEETVSLRIEIGSTGEPPVVDVGPGDFELRIPFRWTRRKPPKVSVHHPTWHTAAAEGSAPRELSFALRQAWIELAER